MIEVLPEDGPCTTLLRRFCKMMNFKFEWIACASFNGIDNESHVLSISNGHTFSIRKLKEITFPNSNIPTYIDTTYFTPTKKTLDECSKHILDISYGNWWTGTQKVRFSELNGRRYESFTLDGYAFVDFSYKFPKSKAELELLLSIKGF